MSHFTTYRIQVLKEPDMELLEKSLHELGYSIEQTKQVGNSYGTSTVDFGLKHGDKSVAVGFIRTNQGLEMRGDFWGTGINDQTFLNDLSQVYVKNMIEDKLSRTSNYTVEEITTAKNGNIEMLVNMA